MIEGMHQTNEVAILTKKNGMTKTVIVGKEMEAQGQILTLIGDMQKILCILMIN